MQQRIKLRPYALAKAVIPCFVLLAPDASAADSGAARHRLQLEQQQHALDLSLRQSLRARQQDLSAPDARRLDQLQTQRFELDQQRLLDSMRRQPLRPTPVPGQLNLP